MTNQTDGDLLPWILGGALLVVTAMAAAAIANSGDSPTIVHTNNQPSTRTIAHPTIVLVNDPSKLPTDEVWECRKHGQRVLSDVPCESRSTIRGVTSINRMHRQPIAADHTPADYSSAIEIPAVSESADLDRAQVDSYCADLRTEVNEINERMRHAYPSQVGDYMRGRLRAINDQQVDLRCVR
jgi:hypothetical protein